jgi:Transcriptional regulator, AbiEi antitoxin, Type IV TA system/Transcriptional regulator, AbiEi antitoxin N-terminal domain
MAGQVGTKLNRLLREWPHGTVAVQGWLSERGVSRQLAEAYRRSGWLERLGRGVYVRADDQVDWLGAVHALQHQLGLSIHPAAKTALQMQGLSHFLAAGTGAPVTLFGAPREKLPSWFRRHDWGARVRYVASNLLPVSSPLGLTQRDVGGFSLTVSAPERAALELLRLVPQRESYEEARLLFEGLTTLRPRLVQQLLEECRSVKAKRLFLHLAEGCGLAWVGKLDLGRVDLGRGKRVIVKGGRFDAKYQITVPESADQQPETMAQA